jgi:hypothetical protein
MKYTETRTLRRNKKEVYVAIPKAFVGILDLSKVEKMVMFMEEWIDDISGRSNRCIVMIPVRDDEEVKK